MSSVTPGATPAFVRDHKLVAKTDAFHLGKGKQSRIRAGALEQDSVKFVRHTPIYESRDKFFDLRQVRFSPDGRHVAVASSSIKIYANRLITEKYDRQIAG